MNERDDMWTQLSNALRKRVDHGWRADEPEQLWCYGLGGASMLVISVQTAKPLPLLLYVYEEDRELRFASPAEVVEALPDLEQRYRGLTPLQQEILASDVDLTSELVDEMVDELARQDEALGVES